MGQVLGVEVGDEFIYRMELNILGVHRPSQAGIDYMKDDKGKILATSVVASGCYKDKEVDDSDVIIYIRINAEMLLKRTRNIASQKTKKQPDVSFKTSKKKHDKSKKKKKLRENGLCKDDIFDGKAKIPIRAVNTIDDEKPPTFMYMVKMTYPDRCKPIPTIPLKVCCCVDLRMWAILQMPIFLLPPSHATRNQVQSLDI
ncbi:unnamed protein product [Cochlearia groenlandica]